jgi:hypothetical protein
VTRWFRWHEGTCEDGKFRVVARNASVTVATVTGVWAVLLEDASHDEHRGIAVRGEDFYAAVLDLGPELQRVLAEMDSIDLIKLCNDKTIEISNWNKRQYETDTVDGTNADRQRRWREKRKTNDTVTDRNGSVTALKRPDTDTDTDTDKNILSGRSATRTKIGYSEEFEQKFWQPYPRSPTMSKSEAWKAWQKLEPDRRLRACEAISPYRRYLQSKPNLETVHACRFLSQERFDGFLNGADHAPETHMGSFV